MTHQHLRSLLAAMALAAVPACNLQVSGDDANCPAENAPVCGEDGLTYPSSCVAGLAGVKVVSTGECGTTPVTPNSCTGIECGVGQTCQEMCAAAGGLVAGTSAGAIIAPSPTECWAECVDIAPPPSSCAAVSCEVGYVCQETCTGYDYGYAGAGAATGTVTGTGTGTVTGAGAADVYYPGSGGTSGIGVGMPSTGGYAGTTGTCSVQCVPAQPSSCAVTDCGPGYTCQDVCTDPYYGGYGAASGSTGGVALPVGTGTGTVTGTATGSGGESSWGTAGAGGAAMILPPSTCYAQCLPIEPPPPATCAYTDCGPGYTCQDVCDGGYAGMGGYSGVGGDGGYWTGTGGAVGGSVGIAGDANVIPPSTCYAQCIPSEPPPDLTCANVDCAPGYTCQENCSSWGSSGAGGAVGYDPAGMPVAPPPACFPECVPVTPVTCGNTVCPTGTQCQEWCAASPCPAGVDCGGAVECKTECVSVLRPIPDPLL